MPLYEYECEACGNRFEKIQKFSDPLVDTCPKCGKGPVHKLLSSPAIQFKGSGWYITDYGKKDGVKDTKAGATTTKDTKEGSESKTTDAAKDTKPAVETSTKFAETKGNT
jgi:putative FmdB family regulatory protein